MSRRVKDAWLVCVAAVLVLGVSACETDDEAVAPVEEADEAAEVEPTTDEEAEADAPQDFPTGTITFIVPYGAGGLFDQWARAIAGPLSDELGVDVVIDNQTPLAQGVAVLARSAPDGHTIGTFNPFDTAGVQFDTDADWDLRDFAYIGNMGTIEEGLIVTATQPWESLEDLKAVDRPLRVGDWAGGLNRRAVYALALEEIGIPATVVGGYEGQAETWPDLITGDLDFTVHPASNQVALGYYESGDVRLIAFFGDERDPIMSDVPTMAELGYPDFPNIATHWPVVAPAGTPEERREVLEAALLRAMESDAFQQWAEDFDAVRELNPLPGDAARELVVSESEVRAGYEE